MQDKQQRLEEQLNDFDLSKRKSALIELLKMAEAGEIQLEPEKEIANMHCHTFYSFNGYGYSPAAVAWMAKKLGIKLVGIVDFDVLDAVEEFLDACEIVGVRGSAGIETRVFIPEFSTREINSPGEPGISYHMGLGFTSGAVGDAGVAILADMRQRADERNRSMLTRLNDYLAPLEIDYEAEVLPLTPAGNATERHMLTAIVKAAEERVADPATFWSEKLGMPVDEIVETKKEFGGF